MRQNIPVQQLLPGMKVVALDIGWSKSPKWGGPFVLDSGEDVALLLQHCKVVAVEKPGAGETASSENPPAQGSVPAAPQSPQPDKTATIPKSPAAPKQQVQNTVSSGGLTDLKKRISKRFVIDSFHECLDLLNRNFDRVRQGFNPQAGELEAASKKLLVSSLAQPGTLTLLSQLEERDNTLERKSLDVAILCLNFAAQLGLPKAKLHRLCMAALLHDIGMIRIPEELLNQKEVLSISQRISIQKHVNHSCDILHKVSALRSLNSIVAYHHERFDGTGYPAGTAGRKIPLEARILSIAMTYEAMTRQRHFCNQATPTEALRKIYALRNQSFDGKLVERFIRSVGVYPVGTLVELNKQQIGMVTDVNQQTRSRPRVRCLFDRSGTALDHQRDLDLASPLCKKVRITRTVEPEELKGFSLQQLAQELGFSRTV